MSLQFTLFKIYAGGIDKVDSFDLNVLWRRGRSVLQVKVSSPSRLLSINRKDDSGIVFGECFEIFLTAGKLNPAPIKSISKLFVGRCFEEWVVFVLLFIKVLFQFEIAYPT